MVKRHIWSGFTKVRTVGVRTVRTEWGVRSFSLFRRFQLFGLFAVRSVRCSGCSSNFEIFAARTVEQRTPYDFDWNKQVDGSWNKIKWHLILFEIQLREATLQHQHEIFPFRLKFKRNSWSDKSKSKNDEKKFQIKLSPRTIRTCLYRFDIGSNILFWM